MKKFLLILSTLVVGAMAEDNKPILTKGEGDGSVSNQTVENYMDKFYGNAEVLARLITDVLVAVTNRGDGKTITQDLVLDKKYGELAIILRKNIGDFKSNVKGTRFKRIKNQTIIHIPVKNIGEKVIISDENGNTLIEYTIIKK